MRNTSRDYIFGPVPSHRLGRSLGVDPFGALGNKTCTLDCIFCEVGSTRLMTTEPIAGPDPNALAQTLLDYLHANPAPDYITVSGSGEPTLWQGLEPFLCLLRESVQIPLAVITNSTTLHQDTVRQALGFARVILPTLTTVDEDTFVHIHAPLPGITAALCARGIRRLRQEVAAQIWLEVLLLRGINDDERGLSLLADAIRQINPHKVQITTLSRPGRMSDLTALSPDELERARSILAQSAVPTETAEFSSSTAQTAAVSEEQIARTGALLRLRWVSLADLARQMGMQADALAGRLAEWFGDEKLDIKEQDGIIFVRLQADDRA